MFPDKDNLFSPGEVDAGNLSFCGGDLTVAIAEDLRKERYRS
jgi:hypothetical protein